ncbi:hypothetical protein CDV36_011221 [Fusarium kuroshium]|uniref:PD-(D/E)XK nuclease-like domain-containing protein n=1 Tax=Fusarium kuroshium TaxID=2010991 RepID=A0A3M2RV43_9HYPO|nr:hypothetical protein CDV36_011221 [Fusarium kuroshium]
MPTQISTLVDDSLEPPALKPHRSAVIQAWVHSVELSNHYDLSPSPPLKRKRGAPSAYRQALKPQSPNLSRASPRTPSPQKSARVLQCNTRATNNENLDATKLAASPDRTPRPTFDNAQPESLSSSPANNIKGKLFSKQHPILSMHDPYMQTLQNIALEPQVSSPDKESTASKSSKTSTSTRSRSPVKRMADLQLSAKPILPYGLDEYTKPLPLNVQDLYKKLRRIAEGRKVVPACVKKTMKSKMGARDHRPLRDNFYETKQTNDQRRPATPAACRRELATIIETCSVARLWASQSVNEASWNALVHCPLLKLALYPPVDETFDSDLGQADLASSSDSDSDSDLSDNEAQGINHKPLDPYGIAANSPVTFWDITTARPHVDCVPRNVHGDMLESKLVDFCLAVSDNEMLDATLRTIQTASSSGRKASSSINHTEYSVLTRRPISVSIETKMPSGSSETALSQLSAWAACHFERLRTLRRFKAEMQGEVLEDESPISIALPLLAAIGTAWKLYFAVDDENEIAIVHTITLGDTEQLVGCYQVVAALRELARWSEITFRAWFIENIIL